MGRDKSQAFYFITVPSFLYSCCAFSSDWAALFPPKHKHHKQQTPQVNLKWQVKYKIWSLKPNCIYISTGRMEYSNGFTEMWSLKQWSWNTALLPLPRVGRYQTTNVRGDRSGSRDEKQCLSQESVLKPSLNRVKKPELSLCQHGQLQNAAARR